MAFSKTDLERIKSKIILSDELAKKAKVVKKGKDSWCCCPFHEEKTPSCKINDDIGTYYCFGCGAKGDIFSLYTDLYKYSFLDAVKELSSKTGITINFQENKNLNINNDVFKILELATKWFEKNLQNNSDCINYFKKRNIDLNTINFFRLGYSYNPEISLYKYLKSLSFKDEDLLKSNVVKLDKNKKIKDFFYKRLIFPINNLQNKVVGFGGRVIDNSNPKYINSPESSFFQKRYLLYNLNAAKESAREKNNILMCEGYMDVIRLYQSGLKSIVAPLGTALTENQLLLAWKYSEKPTIMFDGDIAGKRASYKSALMSLPLLTPKKFLQFVILPDGSDPDSYLNDYSFSELLKLLKKPTSLVDFIFTQSSNALSFNQTDDKIVFDKYLDDIVLTIKDNKIRYFYKNEFKNLFFNRLKLNKKSNTGGSFFTNPTSLMEKQILSFIAAIINHKSLRVFIIDNLKNANFLDKTYQDLISYLDKIDISNLSSKEIIELCQSKEIKKILNKSLENGITELFPYAGSKYDQNLAKSEIEDSVNNLNTRLSNLKKINKSLDTFVSDTNSLNWSELQKLKIEIENDQEKI
ncbi:MAG: DNA primase [Rickettsiales bacterium]|nr:DNA primase [Rickettsiales bacterium]